MSGVSTRGVSLASFQQYLEVWNANANALWSEYIKPRWAVQRMRLYGGKKRSLANYFNRLEDAVQNHDFSEPPCLKVAYGSARFAPGGYGRVSAPTTTAFRSCQNRFPTAVVDEFRTTIMHHGGGGALKLVYSEAKEKAVRGLLWCDSTSSRGKHFVNRDFNAALNISRCFSDAVRPPELMRVRGPMIPKVVGVRIGV